jgi:hypothetical protein
MRTYLTVFLFFIMVLIKAQSIESEKAREDFEYLVQLLENSHPDPYSPFGGKLNFWIAVNKTKKQIPDGTLQVSEFKDILSGFLCQLQDGHTFLQASLGSRSDSILPVEFKVSADRMFFISAVAGNYKYLTGAIIDSINHLPVNTLMQLVKKRVAVENDFGAYRFLSIFLANAGYWRHLLATDHLQLHCTLASGQKRNVQLFYNNPKDRVALQPVNRLRLSTTQQLFFDTLLSNNNVGYFLCNSMMAREVFQLVPRKEWSSQAYNLFRRFPITGSYSSIEDSIRALPSIVESFSALLNKMHQHQSKYLVIDLRKNDGGWSAMGIPLLYMLYGDKYFEYNSDALFATRLSPLLLANKGYHNIEEYNQKNSTAYRQGDFDVQYLFRDTSSVADKKNKFTLDSIDLYRPLLNNKPVYTPKVIVLSEPGTFSAAFQFMYLLKEIGNVIILGVPSSQNGNTYIGVTNFILPASGVKGSISNAIQIYFPAKDFTPATLQPDYPMNYSDYKKYGFDCNAALLKCLELVGRKG